MSATSVWQLEGISERAEHFWITRRKAETDAAANRENLVPMIAIQERLPDLTIIAAHDI